MDEQSVDRDIWCDRCHERPIAYQLRDDSGEVDVRLCLQCYQWLRERQAGARAGQGEAT
jgi:formylmethanofuran dehydrogenase subunit E